MAEIKVLKGQETQVGPIGIVQMGSGGVRRAAAATNWATIV